MDLTVRENIDYFCGLYISDSKKIREHVNQAIAFVKLEKYENFLAKKLSGGLLRRLNIACGIAHKPQLLIFDEPTVAVDAQSRDFILQGIKELNKQGCSIIYTSHYLEEVQMLASRILIMDKGQNIIDGSKDELQNSLNLSEKIFIKVVNDPDRAEEIFSSFSNIETMDRNKDEFELKFSKDTNNLINIVNALNDQKIFYSNIYSEEPTLNDLFLEITGRGLRD